MIETKGREDLDDPPKWERLKDWVADATANGRWRDLPRDVRARGRMEQEAAA